MIYLDKTKKERFKKLVFYTTLSCAIGLLLYLVYEFTGFGFKCPVHTLTGFKCAGCGNTHFVGSILKLNFRDALAFNYMFPLEAFYILWVYFFSAKRYLKEGKFSYTAPFKAFDIVCLIIIALWIPLRNILGV